jgi:catalase (peroxidase I)
MGGERLQTRASDSDAHDPSKKHPPMMTTADLSLRFDPAYEKSRVVSTKTRQNSTHLREPGLS